MAALADWQESSKTGYRLISRLTDWLIDTYWSDFVQQGHAFALHGVKLQLVEFCSYSLQDLTC